METGSVRPILDQGWQGWATYGKSQIQQKVVCRKKAQSEKAKNKEAAEVLTQRTKKPVNWMVLKLHLERLWKIEIYTHSQSAISALAASKVEYLLVVDCIRKLTMWSKNQVSYNVDTWSKRIQQIETADRIREGAKTKYTGSELFPVLDLSRKRTQVERKSLKDVGPSNYEKIKRQVCLEYIGKLDRKHCRLLIRLLMLDLHSSLRHV